MSEIKLTTFGELRDYLAKLVAGLENGTTTQEKVHAASRLAAQISMNLHAEIKLNKLLRDLKEATPAIGDTSIGSKGRVWG